MAEYRSDGEKKYCNWCIGNDAIHGFGKQKSSPRDSNPRPTHYEFIKMFFASSDKMLKPLINGGFVRLEFCNIQ
jgi:hypothetical protein